jgi:hypothetical protein
MADLVYLSSHQGKAQRAVVRATTRQFSRRVQERTADSSFILPEFIPAHSAQSDAPGPLAAPRLEDRAANERDIYDALRQELIDLEREWVGIVSVSETEPN